MARFTEWRKKKDYRTGDTVIYDGAAWVSTCPSRGVPPGFPGARSWRRLQQIDVSATPKADLAESLDNRIGRGA